MRNLDDAMFSRVQVESRGLEFLDYERQGRVAGHETLDTDVGIPWSTAC